VTTFAVKEMLWHSNRVCYNYSNYHARKASASSIARKAKKRYSDLFENANDIVYSHDLAGNYISVNKACERITGYTVEESLKRIWVQAVAPEYMPAAKEMFSRKAKENDLSSYDWELSAKDGPKSKLEIKLPANLFGTAYLCRCKA